jgi:hypothetical protein
MDISKQLESIVTQLVDEIKTKLDGEIQASIVSQIDNALAEFDFTSVVEEVAGPKLDSKIQNFQIDSSKIEAEIGRIGAGAIDTLKNTVTDKVYEAAKEYIDNYNLVPVIEQTVKTYLTKMRFPDQSINSSAIDFADLTLSGDNIAGGIIKNFASTGIDDRASACQLTILDTHVVVEKPILTTGVQVKGSSKVEDNLFVDGIATIAEFNVESEGFAQIINASKQSMQDSFATGVVAPSLKWNDKELINDKELAPTILTSNLRKVGTLEELQTRGETLLDNTLYVSNKRVGVNTLEPSYALSVWDGEIEVAINKINQTRAFIGTHRPTAVTLGSSGKDNISLEPDGSVTINDLRLGALPISTASSQPNWSGIAGEIVFNDSPKIGVPIGWVCLDGHRWANFGLITE